MFLKNKMNLSILIPCYNWNVYQLILDISIQCQKEYNSSLYEIICIEDGSLNLFENSKISNLKNVKYEILSNNIGRSAIRNLLAKKAKFEWLLFIDCDSEILTKDFVKKYKIQSQTNQKDQIFYGETVYKKLNNPKTILHEKYGRKIESRSKEKNFSSHHFLIKKTAFKHISFDEKIKTYGYEDVLFQIKSQLEFRYINNPLYHTGLKNANDFLYDCESGLKNLYNYKQQKEIVEKIKILKWWKKLSFAHYLINKIFLLFKPIIVHNLKSKHPSLLLFQLYKLGIIINLNLNTVKN